ncbi:unnamed protein product [Leptidea sinapis]|uniref:Uncharacterized protein n=1 Tax=Leptidea sinapis TaxID=189913 RepID=A0A5E4PP47_9NEOP|nr:unnamed protein product [Leptidea sinapis]
MEDDNSINKVRLLLCGFIKNQRVRRMLNMEYNDVQDPKNVGRAMPSCLRKNEAVTSKALKDDGKRIQILSDLCLPAGYSQQASFSDTDFTAISRDNNINDMQSSNKNTSHKCDVKVIVTEWNVEDDENEDISKNLANSYEELEEPFSPVVSEYIPETD